MYKKHFIHAMFDSILPNRKSFSRKHFEIFFFPHKKKSFFDTSHKLSAKETFCIECQILFSRKSKKNIINLSSAEFAHSMENVHTGVKMCLTSDLEQPEGGTCMRKGNICVMSL